MKKTIVSTVVCAAMFAGSAYGAESLSDLKAFESAAGASAAANTSKVDNIGRLGSGAGNHSPSQVVILNNTPNTRQGQEQNQISEQDQDQFQNQKLRQLQRARIGVGTGQSLELLRETRIQKEAKNEQVLIEKLEESRMEDEKSRLRRLFKIREYNKRRHYEMGEDDEFGSIESDYERDHHVADVHEVNVVPAPTVVASNIPAYKPTVVTPDVHVEKGVSAYTPTKTWGSNKHYIKGQIGLGDYSDAENAFSTSSWGVVVGKEVSPRIYAEIGLYKTSYEVFDPNPEAGFDPFFGRVASQYRDLDQYNLSGALGLNIIKTKGVLGSLRGGLSYVRRDSESSDIKGFQSFRSNTVDALIGASADIEVANNIYVTGSFDYYTNILSDIASTDLKVVENVENSNYYVLGVGLKLKF